MIPFCRGVVLGLAAACGLVIPPVAAQTVEHLSLDQAEQRAVANHPSVRAGEYATLAAGEEVRQVRSAYLPTVYASFTGAQAQDGTRIAAGGLNNPAILDRFAYGISGAQMLTDFGRTSELTASAVYRVDSQQHDVEDRRAHVLLGVDRAYLETLRAQAVARVARETLTTRQIVLDQVTALASSGLKSALDLSFAKVNTSEAQLLVVQAENDVQSSFATLSAALGVPGGGTYDLADVDTRDQLSDDVDALIAEALQKRPDVARERSLHQAQIKTAAAERALWFPTISLVGAAGLTPFHQGGFTDRYSAVGINLSLPVTTGGMFAARRAEANFRAQAEQHVILDTETRVSRDVRVAWLDAKTALQRLSLTEQLVAQANDALQLAQARYSLGLSSIVELTQGQLNHTRAEIERATARYDYEIKRASLKFQSGTLK
jgi:outer membrane protein